MTEKELLTSAPIEPVYCQTNPSQPIELGTVAVQFRQNSTSYDETAKVTMLFLPDDRLQFVLPLADKPAIGPGLFVDAKPGETLTLSDRGVTVDVFCTAVGSRLGLVFYPINSPLTVTSPSNEISTANVHLFNLP